MIVNLSETSSALNYGIVPDVKTWMQAGAKQIIQFLQAGAGKAKAFISSFKDWAKAAMAESKKTGGNILKTIGAGIASAFKKTIISIVVVGAISVAITGVILAGPVAIGWIAGGAGLLASILTLLQVTGLFDVGSFVRGTLNFSEQVYSFNWQQTDKQLKAEIESLITSLYEPAGEFLGRSIAGLLVGGASSMTRVRVNIPQMALLWQLNPDIRDELLQNVSSFCYQSLTAAKVIAFKIFFMKGRAYIKENWDKLPKTVQNAFPDLSNKIRTWGDEGNKSWSIAGVMGEGIESIDDERLRGAAEGFVEGFWEGFRESVEYVYA